MRCPGCRESNKDRVIDSRMTEGGGVIRRRRECLACGRRFTTKERVEEELRLTVVKRDSRRVPYDREKIKRGLIRACWKLAIEENDIDRLIDDVEGDIFADHDRQVSSAEIGEYVVRRLRDLHAVAYVRFMAVFRRFHDVDEFVDEIRNVHELAQVQRPDQPSLFDTTGIPPRTPPESPTSA